MPKYAANMAASHCSTIDMAREFSVVNSTNGAQSSPASNTASEVSVSYTESSYTFIIGHTKSKIDAAMRTDARFRCHKVAR